MLKIEETGAPAPASGRSQKRRNDLILIGILLAVLAIFAALLLLTQKDGDCVVVTVDGETFGVYPLSRDTAVEIRTGDAGEHLNRLVIQNGKAMVETANCPDGICAAHRPISHDGESIICLPHKVVVAVEREK